jgi:hypothetical protein
MATARAPAESRGPPVHPGRCRYDSPGWQRYRPNRGDLLRGRRRAQAARSVHARARGQGREGAGEPGAARGCARLARRHHGPTPRLRDAGRRPRPGQARGGPAAAGRDGSSGRCHSATGCRTSPTPRQRSLSGECTSGSSCGPPSASRLLCMGSGTLGAHAFAAGPRRKEQRGGRVRSTDTAMPGWHGEARLRRVR